jgi:hypothetical protein
VMRAPCWWLRECGVGSMFDFDNIRILANWRGA